MVSSVSGSSGATYVGILLSSISGNTGSSGGAVPGGGDDTIFISAQAQQLLSLIAVMHGSQDQTSSAEEIRSLAAQLGPVVVTSDGSGPGIEVTPLSPDTQLSRLASLLRGEADRGSLPSAGYFASVRTGDGADAILAGDPTAPADASGGLKALVDSGAGDDRIEVNGHALVRGGTGNDSIIANGGSLLVSFARDDGNDSITLNGGAAIGLLLGDDVAESDLLLAREGNDLVLRIHNTNDSITIRNFQAAQQGYVRFGDGNRTLAELTAGLDFTA